MAVWAQSSQRATWPRHGGAMLRMDELPCGSSRWRSSPSSGRDSHGRGWLDARRPRGRGRCPRPPELAVPRRPSYLGGSPLLGPIGVSRSSGLVTSRSTLLASRRSAPPVTSSQLGLDLPKSTILRAAPSRVSGFVPWHTCPVPGQQPGTSENSVTFPSLRQVPD
jgi:hypothetical protein